MKQISYTKDKIGNYLAEMLGEVIDAISRYLHL